MNRSAFSGASAFPVVEHTIIMPCLIVEFDSLGGVIHVSRHFFLYELRSQQVTDVKYPRKDGFLRYDSYVDVRSLAICSALPVADP